MPELSLAVCACTYKRPEGLRALLAGIAALTFHDTTARLGTRPRLTVVIADNEGSEQVRAICADFGNRGTWPLTYVRETRRGISFVRNACLEHLPPECAFFAFIDDDEVPAPDWLDQLLRAQAATGADVVAGRVVPVFAEGAPGWIREGGFFGSPRRLYDLDVPERADLQELRYAATNNVLVRAPVHVRFDPAFALSGGEDTAFFLGLRESGARIVHARHAVVFDHVPAAKATFRYMFKERFRMANSDIFAHAAVSGSRPRNRLAEVSDGVGHLGLAARRWAKTLMSSKRSRDRFAVGAFHAAYGLGIIAAAFGFRYQHYK